MIDVDKDREATASIRGYFYQLDAALLEILSANLSDKFVIEGIEDLDLYGSDSIIYYQIKYYESQTLTNSTIRKPVHKMFMHFIRLDKANRPGRKYIIYGYFKEIKIPLKISSATAFRELMKYTTRPKDKPAVIKSLLDDVSADDQVVQAFCDAFEIRESLEFGEHRTRAINAVQKNQSVSKLEAEGFHYPRAANFIASLAIKSAHTERTTTLQALQKHLEGTQAIHHHWLLREEENAKYARRRRKMYFEKVNIIGVIRAFSIEVSISTDASSVYDQLRQMADKWSTAGTKRLGTMERHAPYVLLRNATDSTLADIKTKLFDAGIDFVDGYPYKGSKFQIDHLNTPQTQERRIALRISESWDQTIRAIRALEPV